MLVQGLSRDTTLNGAIHVIVLHGHDLVHCRHVDADATMGRMYLTFDGRPCAKRNDRHAVFRTSSQHVGHILGRCHHDNGVWPSGRQMAFATAMVFAGCF